MYNPAQFEQTDTGALHDLMRAHPLAVLVSDDAEGLTADHVPLAFVPPCPNGGPNSGPHGVLRGHVARANPLWQRADQRPVLAIFRGLQAYITPSWYATKAATHKVVPTWNYAVVHAHGTLHAVDNAPWVHALVSDLTDRHENKRHAPWAVADAPDDYVQQMLRAIVGIEIRIERLVGKWKLSQNRNEADRNGVADGLAAEVAAEAQAMAPLVRAKKP